jgi:hypothetical protein
MGAGKISFRRWNEVGSIPAESDVGVPHPLQATDGNLYGTTQLPDGTIFKSGSAPSKLNTVVNVCAGNDPGAHSQNAANIKGIRDFLAATDSVANASARTDVERWASLEIMTTS